MADVRVTGIILAGGLSSRMGVDKGLLEFNGVELVKTTIDVLRQVVDSLLIVSNNADYHKFGFQVVEDIHPLKGPLSGIHTGLTHSSTELNLFLPCDSPLVSKSILQKLIKQHHFHTEMTYLKHSSSVFPLSAIYTKSSLPKIEEQLSADRLKVRNLMGVLKSKAVPLTKAEYKLMMNVNSPQDFEILQSMSDEIV